MALIIGATAAKGLVLVSETEDKGTKTLILSSFDTENLFFYLAKHQTELFKKIKDSELKTKIQWMFDNPTEE